MPSDACFAVFVISYKIEATHKSTKWLEVACTLFLYFQALVIDIALMENNKVEIGTANEIHAAPVHITLRLSKVRPSGLMNGHSVVMS